MHRVLGLLAMRFNEIVTDRQLITTHKIEHTNRTDGMDNDRADSFYSISFFLSLYVLYCAGCPIDQEQIDSSNTKLSMFGAN